MSQVVIRKTENSVGVTLPGGTSFFKTGVLQASNGVSSHGINVQDTETSDYILRDFPFSEIKEADGTQFDTTRDATVTALNNLINASADTFIKDTDKITALDGVTESDFTAKEGYGVFVGATDGSIQTSGDVILGATEITVSTDIKLNNGDITSNTNQNIDLIPGGTGKVRLYNEYNFPVTDGTNGQVLQTDGVGNLSFATAGGSDTNIANADLTADNNRTLDMDANSLTIDINDGDFTLRDSNANDTYIQAGVNVLTLGDSGMTVRSNGIIQAEFGIEQDEANLTTLGDFGAGCDITYMGAAATAVSQGRVYYWSGATWVAYTPASEAPQKALLGIALGTSMSKGFLLKGFIHPDSGTLTAGSQVFGFTNASVGTTAPTTSGHFQRILGHSISTSVIYFNPSQEYIEIA